MDCKCVVLQQRLFWKYREAVGAGTDNWTEKKHFLGSQNERNLCSSGWGTGFGLGQYPDLTMALAKNALFRMNLIENLAELYAA